METDIYERTRGEPLPSNADINVDIEATKEVIARHIAGMVEERFEKLAESATITFLNKGDAHFSMPFEWNLLNGDGHNNPPVENPLTLDFCFYYSDYDNPLVWRGNLQALIDDVLVISMYGEVISKNTAQKMVVPIRDELLKLVDKLNYYIDTAEEIKGEDQ
jgi:hypothetical protein